jgi:hypothetical protein
VFDKLKKAVSGKVGELQQLTALPPDLAAVPDVGGVELGAIDRAVLSAYLGREVAAVGPLGPGGAEATSFVGERVQARLRQRNDAATAATGVERHPGELIPGQIEAAMARLRAQGMPEAMIEQARARIGAATGEHFGDGWSVTFADDHRASVQVFAAGTEGAAEFDKLASRFARENGTDGHRPQDTPLLSATVQPVRGTPYESYALTGRLAARGAAHVAVAASPRVATPILAALAAVALRSAEGRPR